MKRFVFILIWILFTVSCEKLEEPTKKLGGVDGVTFIGSTNEPIPNLRVDIPGYNSKVTDENGYYKFNNVKVGDYTVSVYQNSKFLSSKPTNVVEGNIAHVWFSFEYEAPPKKDLPDLSVVDLTSENLGWDYKVVGKEEYFYIDVENSKPKSVFYHTFKDNKDYGITFNDKGLPKRVITDGFVFLFANFNGNKVDLAIIFPSNESQIFREIKTDFVWPTSSKSTQSKADVIRWTGRILGAIPCVASGVTAVFTGGFAVPLALWTCGNYFLSLVNNFYEDAYIENGFTRFVDQYHLESTAYKCTTSGDPSSCLIALANKGLDKFADYVKEMEKREAYIAKIEELVVNNTPLKTIAIQPGPEGKDASVRLWSFDDCIDHYEHFGDDSLIMIIYDHWGTCAKEFQKMLLQFQLSGKVPSNSIIFSARLAVYGRGVTNSREIPTLSLFRINSFWDENTTEWINDSGLYPLGDIDLIHEGNDSIYSWDVTSVVQDWVSGEEINFGFQISSLENSVYATIYSGDHPNTIRRPKLIISYY